MASLPPPSLESRQPVLLGVFGLLMGLQIVAVALRFVSKWVCKLRWGLDDLFVFLGFITSIAVAVGAIIDVVDGGVGLHTEYVVQTNPGGLKVLAKIIVGVPIIYLAAVVFPKLALVHLYLSVFVQKAFRIMCWIIVGVLLANWFATTVAAFKICVPFDQLWNPVPGGYCLNQNSFYHWLSFANILTDVALLLIPIPYILKIQVSKTLRLGILFTFLLGSVGLVSSVIRFVAFSGSNVQDDPTWVAGNLLIWTAAEPATYLIAVCLPSYRPLLKLLSRKITGKTGTNKNEYGRYAKESGYARFERDEDSLQLNHLTNNVNTVTAHSDTDGASDIPGKGIRVTHSIEFGSASAR